MPEFLLNLDNNITLALNGSNSLYADGIMLQATSTLTWIPVGVILIYVIVKNNEFPRLLTTIAMLVACVAICTTLSEISKALFERWRPCNDPFIMHAVKTVNGYREAKFGFFSAHSANTMSIAVFLSLLFKKPRATLFILTWSVLNGWSRIYLGVHYFGDVITGFAVGAIAGGILYIVCTKISSHISPSPHAISSEYTRGGFPTADVDLLTFALLLTYGFIAVAACVKCA